ncbi:MAG: cupin domain-containing protein [Halodesulfurarchaeum sp.]
MDRLSESDVTAAEPVDDVFLKLLASGESMNIQHFRIEPGATVPEHSHHHEQLGYITQGTLVFLVDGEELPVGPGDSYSIPGGEPHAAENRGEETVLGIDVFSPPRDNPDWAE